MDYSSNQSNLHTLIGAFVTKLERQQPQKPSNAQIAKKSCAFCKSNSHPTSKCDIIKDSQQQIEVVKTENLCFNSLGHHKVVQCTSKYRCKVCRRKHHSSLCDVNANTKSQSQPEKDSAITTTADTKTSLLILVSSDSTHNLISPSSTKCLLKTAITDMLAGPRRCSANILLDEGAQQSFISQKLADQLQTSTSETCLSQHLGGPQHPIPYSPPVLS